VRQWQQQHVAQLAVVLLRLALVQQLQGQPQSSQQQGPLQQARQQVLLAVLVV
jgi:hypothetical protein